MEYKNGTSKMQDRPQKLTKSYKLIIWPIFRLQV